MLKKKAPNTGTTTNDRLSLKVNNFNKITPIKAIRSHCIDCCCGSKLEVKFCPSVKCSLYPYRLGHKPKVVDYTPQGELFQDIPEETPKIEQRPVDELIMVF